MSEYAIFFQKEKTIIRLPVNPEELEISTSQAAEKYTILKLGQIVIPTHMELKIYSFDVELPFCETHYTETMSDFKSAEEYLNIFETWRKALEPIRFMAGKVISGNAVSNDAINVAVLIESLIITEKAGEEQDKYVSFKLTEYNDYVVSKIESSKKNPSSKRYYTVRKGDTLWAIAKKYYDNGASYTKIYNKNKDKIKNPNLIYPGQRLVIP